MRGSAKVPLFWGFFAIMPKPPAATPPLFHTVEGEGPPLVLLHGFCADHRSWNAVRPALAKRFRVITPDLPGCGRSPVPATADLATVAAAVVHLLDHLGIDRAAVVGHSMGGYVALELLAQYADRLTGLGLLHSHPYAQLSDEEPRERTRSIAFVERYGAALYVKQLLPTLFAPNYHDRVELEKLTHRALETPAAGIAACQRAMLHRADHTATLSAAPVPVLQVFGEADVVIPTEVGERASVLPPVGTIHWLPGVGHSGMIERPKAVVQLLRDWLDQLE